MERQAKERGSEINFATMTTNWYYLPDIMEIMVA